ncbi:hypothetical protein TrCOL_g4969 [Triparma columacea]|uniref:Uncharacterized protein n=1 Tax=Triparma columacea TaxID=722753 RepID=A0A9W7GJM6_9STRA|nr:hypothetical protein TrCOL_g4969 [Triparma columacea]
MDLLNSMQDQGLNEQLESARAELVAVKDQNSLLKNKIHILNSTVSTITAEKTALQAEVTVLREMLDLDQPTSSSATSTSTLLSPLFPPPPTTTLALSNNIPSPSKSNITAVASTPTCTYTAHSDRTVYSITHGLYDSEGGLLPTRSTSPAASQIGNVSAPVIAMEVIGSKIVVACLDGKVLLHNLDGGEGFEELTKHPNRITTMISYPPSSSVLTADTSGILKITSLSSSNPSQTTARLETNVVSACFSSPYLYLYADGVHVHRYSPPSPGGQGLGPALLIPVNRGEDLHKSTRILHMEASEDGRHLAGQTDKGKIIIWNIEGRGETNVPDIVRELYGHQGDDFFLGLLLWDSDSSRIISNSFDNYLYLYSCSTGEALQIIKGEGDGEGHRGKIRDMKRCGDAITTAGWDGWVKIWVFV